MKTFHINTKESFIADSISISKANQTPENNIQEQNNKGIEFRSFISLSTEQAPIARVLVDLVQMHFPDASPCFEATNDLRLGDRWLEKTAEALRSARFFFLLVGEQEMQKHWLHFETGAAWQRGIPIFVLSHTGVQITTLPQPYTNFQGCEIDTHQGIRKFVLDLSSHLKIESPKSVDFSSILEDIEEAKKQSSE
ncbi:MAG: hypothetical protein AAFX90_20095 [Pseudomonadota bacterium]